MNIKEFEKMKVQKTLPLGTHKVVFQKLELVTDDDGEITRILVHIKDYKPLAIFAFEGENYQLDLLGEQLKTDTYAEMNEKTGTKIIVHRFERKNENNGEIYTNTSFNPRAKTEKTVQVA